MSRFRILGPVEVDGVGPLGGPKQRALLAFLLLRSGRVVQRAELIDELWDHDPPDTAEHGLQVYVSNLRKALGGAATVSTVPQGYRVELNSGTIDVAEFERLSLEGRSLLEAGDHARAAEVLGAALALWRGPLAGGVALHAEAARLEELRTNMIEDRIEAELAMGRHRDLVAELEQLVREHPLRERFHRQLMLALYGAGRQVDALDAYKRARRTFLDELGLDPSDALRDLERSILRQDESLLVEPAEIRARRHLPTPATPFLGRQTELADILAHFESGARLVTLTGPGGTGKTRLAIECARRVTPRFDDGVYFADLAALSDPELLEESVATALGLKDPADLAAHLSSRRLLLVLDNFEQVEAAAPTLSGWLRDSAGLALLVTSRIQLQLYGEHVLSVPPLEVDEATELFVARARASGSAAASSSVVAELCEWLDRLPLAIELVAARSRDFTPQQLMRLLPSRLESASGGPRDVPSRHRALRATIEWSYDLLDEPDRHVFRRLGVFAGEFDRDAALAVAGADEEVLTRLVAASMLVPTGPRLTLLQTIREYALEELEQTAETAAARDAHLEHYAGVAASAERELGGPDEAKWLERLEKDHDNCRAALEWAAEHRGGGLRLAVGLRRFWFVRGHIREALRTLERALAVATDEPVVLRATAAGALGQFALVAGDLTTAAARTRESLELFRTVDDHAGVARSLNRLGDIAKAEGDEAGARSHYDAALELARTLDDEHPLAAVLTNAGSFALLRGDAVEAEQLTGEALDVWRRLEHTEGIAIALHNLSVAAVQRGDPAAALPTLQESLDLTEELGYTLQLAAALALCAHVALRVGMAARAATLVGALDGLLEDAQLPLPLHAQRVRDETVFELEAELTHVDVTEMMGRGRGLTRTAATAFARETLAQAVTTAG